MSNQYRSWAWLVLLLPLLANAHGLLLDVESNGRTIFGTAYYSNGEKAAGEPMSLVDLSEPTTGAVHATTDSAGNFRFDALPSHRYRVTVFGGEGHSVQVELVADAQTRPQLIDAELSEDSPLWPPPAWAIVGGLLLVSLVPALVYRRSR